MSNSSLSTTSSNTAEYIDTKMDNLSQQSLSEKTCATNDSQVDIASSASHEALNEGEKSPDRPVRRSNSMDTGKLRAFSPRPLPAFDLPIDITVKETKASRRRNESIANNIKHKEEATAKANKKQDYLTPLQRKDKRIKEMAARIRELESMVREKDFKLCQFEAEKKQVLDNMVQERETDKEVLLTKMEGLKMAYDELAISHDQAIENNNDLEETIAKIEEEMMRRDEEKSAMLYAMFEKGRRCAEFERQENLDQALKVNPNSVAVRELLLRLENTESKLEHWQTVRRQESYEDAATRHFNESEVTLRFLRDSVLHFFTGSQEKLHLNAIISLLGFTEVQKTRIYRALEAKHKK